MREVEKTSPNASKMRKTITSLESKKESNHFQAPDEHKKFKEGIKHNIAIEVNIQGGDQKKLKPLMSSKFKEGII